MFCAIYVYVPFVYFSHGAGGSVQGVILNEFLMENFSLHDNYFQLTQAIIREMDLE